MKSIIVIIAAVTILAGFPLSDSRTENVNVGYSQSSFFVKTHTELKISEATGKISLMTGIEELDKTIAEHGISEITLVFRLNNGDRESYYRLGMNTIYLLKKTDGNISGIRELSERLSKNDEIEYCELNYLGTAAGTRDITAGIPDDEMFYKQWYLMNTGFISSSGGRSGKVGADINMINAWNIESGSDSVVVAILDSGIQDEHPDLRSRIWINMDEIPGNGIDDDNNGYIDDTKGWDFAYNDRRPSDGFGHGTNIATVIGANTDNRIGFAGVDRKCRLMNCKNLNSDNSGEYSWWSESIKYAVDNGADIINMSEGGDEPSRVLKTAINYALENDVMVVAAMMNKGDNRDYYPAVYEGVFAVGATDTDDQRCKRFSWGGGSCWGSHIAVVAPGNKIYGLDYEDENNYEVYWSGTSQSTAIVSGLAALLLAQDNSRSYRDIQRIIRETAKDQVGDPREDVKGWDQFHGFGRVDAFMALTYSMDLQDVLKYSEPPNTEEKKERIEEEEPEKSTDGSTKSKVAEPSKPK